MDTSKSTEQFALNSPSLSVLPGVGGMFIRGFGLVRGPPSAVGIPVYYFHPLQPPSFDRGLYNGLLTSFNVDIQNSQKSKRSNSNYNDESNSSNDENESNNFKKNYKRPEPEPSSKPYVPIKRDKSTKPQEKPKAQGMGSVLEELRLKLASRSGVGLKKVDTSDKKQIGKLAVGGKKGGFVNMMDELKYRLNALNNGEKISEVEKGITPKSKSNEGKKELLKDDKIDIKDDTIPDTKVNSEVDVSSVKNSENICISYSTNIPFPPPLPTSWPDSKNNYQVDSSVDSNDNRIIPMPPELPTTWPPVTSSDNVEVIPLPPELPNTWPPTLFQSNSTDKLNETNIAPPNSRSDSPVKLPNETIISNSQTDISNDFKPIDTPNMNEIGKEKENRIVDIINVQGFVNNLPSGISVNTQQNDLPLPSGYYIPAPRLDMVAPGSFEFAGLTTANMIEKMQRLVRAAIHNAENKVDKPTVTNMKEILPKKQKPFESFIKPIDPILGDDVSVTSSNVDTFITPTQSFDSIEQKITTEVIIPTYRRTVRKPADYFRSISRMRQATTKREEELKVEQSLELRSYDVSNEISFESTKGLPLQPKSVTTPTQYKSAVEKRNKQKGNQTYRQSTNDSNRIEPICSTIKSFNVASTSAMNGFDNLGQGLFISSLRKPEVINNHKSQKTLNINPPKLTETTKISKRKEKQKNIELKLKNENIQLIKENKKNLYDKAIQQAKLSGNYIGSLGGSYTDRLITKYSYVPLKHFSNNNNNISQQLFLEKRNYQQKNGLDVKLEVLDESWKVATSYKNYKDAMTLHELLVTNELNQNRNNYTVNYNGNIDHDIDIDDFLISKYDSNYKNKSFQNS